MSSQVKLLIHVIAFWDEPLCHQVTGASYPSVVCYLNVPRTGKTGDAATRLREGARYGASRKGGHRSRSGQRESAGKGRHYVICGTDSQSRGLEVDSDCRQCPPTADLSFYRFSKPPCRLSFHLCVSRCTGACVFVPCGIFRGTCSSEWSRVRSPKRRG
jgi:hypothetical protein